MASPFRIFRKHSKGMMAALVVLCMGLFVFSRGSGGSGRNDGRPDGSSLVATWNGGEINQAQLGSLVAQRMILEEFLQRLFVQGGGRSEYDLPMSVPNFLLGTKNVGVLEQQVVTTEVVADLARKSGLVVGDQLINDYIREFGLKKVGGDDVRAILASIGSNGAATNEAIVLDALRKLLMAHFYQMGYASGSYVVMPEQRWTDWRRVNERISVQAAIMPVDKFLPQVKQPTDAQLQALYNDHKDQEPEQFVQSYYRTLPAPGPGFKEPRRVQLQFLLASVNDRADQLAASITDDEIQEYYDRNKRTEFVKTSLLDDEPAEDEAAKSTEESTDDSADAQDETAPAANGKEAEAPATEDKAGEDAAPEEQPAAETSSSHLPKSPFRLVAAQAETAEKPADAAAESEATESAAGQDAAEVQDAEVEEAAEAASSTDGEAKGDSAAEEEDAEAVEYEPLEKVRDEIRKSLATDKAVQELEQATGEIAAQMQTEYNRYASLVAEAKELKKDLPKPTEKLSDFGWLQAKYGFKAEKTALLTARELSETAVGKSADLQRRATTLQAVFGYMQPYEPMLARDLNGDWFIITKIEDQPEKVPTFAECRDQVIAAWKRAEAGKLAENEAAKLAAEAEKSTTPFDELFASKGYEVVKQTEMFSFRSYSGASPGQGNPPALGTVPELENVGADFMEAAFALDGPKTAAVMNTDRSAAYVIRLHSRQYPPDELKQLFLEETNQWPGQLDMMREHIQEFSSAASRDTLVNRAGFKFDEAWLQRRNEELASRQ
jgi:hypothetical protein